MKDFGVLSERSKELLTLTVRQLAEQMQISLPTAYAMVEQQGFPLLRIGKRKLIPRAAQERWLEEQVVG